MLSVFMKERNRLSLCVHTLSCYHGRVFLSCLSDCRYYTHTVSSTVSLSLYTHSLSLSLYTTGVRVLS